MDELLKQLTGNLGIDETTAQAATGKAMSWLKDQAGQDVFAKISEAIPGLDALADDALASQAGGDAPASGGGGMFGKLAGMASDALGGAGGGLELGSMLSSAGLDAGQIGGFVATLLEFVKEKAGSEVVDQILAKVPALKSMLG